MSEEDCPKYKDGDVVWVKLGPCWWPGEVTENGPEDFSSKKPPLAIVKFFNESTYEFVKSYNNIYFYNCERKNEFIKKGMDSFRANNSHMEKFPGDVSLAEIRTDGNPNILSDPMFAPQKRSNIIAEVFGSPSPKKANKEGARHSRGRSSTSKNSSKKQTPKVNITHRRFLGCDDYEAHIRVQYPGKDAGHLSSDEEITRLNAEPTQTFDCSSCSFKTTRLEVMLFHVQCHIKGISSPVQVKKKSPPKKKRSRIVKHITSDDDRTNSSAGYVDTDSEEEAKPKQKRKRRSQGGSAKRTKQKKTVEEEKAPVTDIRTNLLAEWSDSEENDDGESSKVNTSGENVEETGDKDNNKEEQSNNQQKDLSKSCFDFDEEEEEDNSIIHTAVGRKIPRVIPEKRKSTDPDNEDASLPLAEDDENRMEILKVNENLNENSTEKDTELVKEESQFKELLESTSVPDLPEVPDTIKPSQHNLSDDKSVKIPDKKDNNVTEVATKLTNPKKRFVKSFEDFELLLNEQRRAQEEREEELRRDKKKEKVTVEPVEVIEPKVVEDLDAKVPQTEDSSSMELEEPIEEVIPEKTEQKLTDSKTTNEDEEEKPIEKEETKITEPVVEEEEAVEEQKRVETPAEESKTVEETLEEEKSEDKSEETGKETTEEESSGESSKKSDSNLQISKLKCQIMSKLSDEDAEPSKSSKTKPSQHKTPRSKILDKYNEQKSKKSSRSSEEKEEATLEESVVNSSNKKGHAPKKSKYLKFNQEEATGSGGESLEKIEEEQTTKEETNKDVIKEVETISEKTNPDEEIRKINQIDEYFKDFLFSFQNKKEENSPKETVTEEMKIAEDSTSKEEEEKSITNEVRIKCAGSDEESEGDLDIAIKTNLTNFNKNVEEMSALSTLAMVSQLENNFEKSAQEEEKMEEETPAPAPIPETLPEPVKPIFEEHFVKKPESELITIDGNLTVVSEKDLADGQVEITANASPSYKKPVTLTNFSMDFSECNSNSDSVSSEQSDSKSQEEIKTGETNQEATKKSSGDVLYDLEEHIPSQIVDKSKPAVAAAAATPPPTSKLLERLTTTTTAAVTPEVKVPVSKTAPKVPTTTTVATKPTKTKFVIKQPPLQTTNTNNKFVKSGSPAQTTASSKPIILSEKIIKPAKVPSESAGSVSVQKITSKRNLHDPDEIDTYIIQKEGKSVDEDEELELSLSEDLPEVPTKKFKRTPQSGLVKKLQQQTPSPTAVKKRSGGKAKILQQTIITPAGEIIQPTVAQTATAVTDDNVFDINSMPIVLSDQILTPESIENMPIFLSDTVQTTGEMVTPITTTTKLIQHQQPATVVKKSPAQQGQMRLLNKSISTPPSLISTTTGVVEKKMVKTPKILSSVGSKIIKQNSFAAGSSSKHGKYVIVTSSSTTPQTKYAVSKKQPTLIKRTSGGDLSGTLTKMTPEPSGNKIMILTNQQGQQQRVLLTPAQQKMMGYQTSQGGKVTKTVVKGNIIQKSKDGQMAVAGSSGLISKSIGSSRMNSNQTLISSSGHVLTQIHPHQQQKIARIEKSSPMSSSTGRKLQMQSQKVPLKPQQKTILIKNQHGQTVRKIQGTDDALLDQQVAEQLEAIKASGMLQQKQEILNYKAATTPKTIRRSYAKKVDSPKQQMVTKMATNANLVKAEAAVPPLAPISPKKPEQQIHVSPTEKVTVTNQQQEAKAQQQQQERPLNQLVIQDAMGNQTTITEGQILALPSETVDGQPQSYMLVTLDESGNLTPLNNEALLSLDPNLGLGGDLGNTVLQIDQSALKEETTQQEVEVQQQQQQTEAVVAKQQPEEVKETIVAASEEVMTAAEKAQEQLSVEAAAAALQTVNCSVGAAETGQQLIVTGDPIAAQKFLESLTEGNTDLANILASAEGSSILIQADGQQILINTDSDNQMLLSVNTDNLNMAESSEGGGNPIFATQPPSKNQDILAAALADTDVFQQEQQNGGGGGGGSSSQSGGGGNAGNKVQSQLSPNSALYPINVGNVLETSLTLNSPIMTPLEVPSTNSKKIISDENDILNQVPKNVDLPITITDPNISQTVSQQQVASLMVNELQSNLELSLPISESITVASSDMNSPSFVYSLPNLDGSVDIGQKAFNSSMPLLTEDGEESTETPPKKEEEEEPEEAASKTTTTPPPTEDTSTTIDQKVEEDTKSEDSKIASEGSFLDESEGLCTLGSEMCSSLSEPPPDMFDLSAVLSSHHQMKETSPTEEKQTEEGKSVGGGDNMEIEEAELKIDDKVGEESVSSESANQESVSTSSPATMMNEDSCEIPVQPEIVTTLKESDGFEDEATTTTTSNDKEEEVVGETTESKSCKFD